MGTAVEISALWMKYLHICDDSTFLINSTNKSILKQSQSLKHPLLGYYILFSVSRFRPSKHEKFNQRWVNVSLTLQTVDQH